jgi:hypothetical protein
VLPARLLSVLVPSERLLSVPGPSERLLSVRLPCVQVWPEPALLVEGLIEAARRTRPRSPVPAERAQREPERLALEPGPPERVLLNPAHLRAWQPGRRLRRRS